MIGAPTIRPATEDDAPALADLHVRAWQWAYRGLLPDGYLADLPRQTADREAMWCRQVREPPASSPVWVAERDGRVIGFCNAVPSRSGEPGTADLLTLYVEPEVVGTGVGAALMRRALDDLRARGYRAALLWVLEGNERARRFYERWGWVPDGARRSEEIWGAVAEEVRYRIELAEPTRS